MALTPPSQSQPSTLEPIKGRYLLATICLPFYLDAKGRRYLDPLWVKDLREHLKYLENLTLASPCRYEDPPPGMVCLNDDPAFAKVQYVDMPTATSIVQALQMLPTTIYQYWQAVQKADILHTGIVGWPFPDAWLLIPITRLQKKFCLINVESAPWRLAAGVSASWKTRLRASLTEIINRWCLANAEIAFFTQEDYRRSLLSKQPSRGSYVLNASWIDQETVLTEAEAAAIWARKRSLLPLRLLFAGRLVDSKGVHVLLKALDILNQQGIPIEVDILGQGDLQTACEQASQRLQSAVTLNLLGTVSYGPDFFRLLQGYHAIVVPSLTDEQPRIVYDAYSQAIPILASDTPGLRDCIHDGKTGKLIPPNDAAALANLLQWATEHPDQLEAMGRDALAIARNFTHEEMHRRRWQILLNTLSDEQIKGTAR